MAESDLYRLPFRDGLRTTKAQRDYVEFIQAQRDYVEFLYAFLFRFAVVAAIFLLAVLIAYLAR